MVAQYDKTKAPAHTQGSTPRYDFVRILDGNGNDVMGNVYQLASNVALAATSASAVTAGVQGGSYLWDVQFAGTSVTLQALASDGVTWRNVATANASGTIGVVIGQNASLRLYNPNGTPDTAVYSSIS